MSENTETSSIQEFSINLGDDSDKADRIRHIKSVLVERGLLGAQFMYSGCAIQSARKLSSRMIPGSIYCADDIEDYGMDVQTPLDYALDYEHGALVVYDAQYLHADERGALDCYTPTGREAIRAIISLSGY